MTAIPDPFRGKAIALLLLAGAVAYTGAVNTGFVFDDLIWISGNPQITDPAAYLRVSGDRTLVALTVLANYQLGGLNPLGYHAFNVAVHLTAGLTLFALLGRVLALPRWGGRFAGRETHLAFAAALLWTVHPLNTQAVTYVIQRAESMMGLFYLLTFYCWTRAATGPRPLLWQALAAVAFLASCFSKEVAVTLPPVLLLYDRLFLATSWKQVFTRRAGYLLLAGVWVFKLYFVFGTAFGGGSATGVGFGLPISRTQYALTQTEVILHYLRLTFWPVGQNADYNGWPVADSFADVWPSALALGAILLASALLLFYRPRLGFLAAWFFLILAPTSSVMPIADLAFEHRMYLSLVAVVVGVVLLGDFALQAWPTTRGRWAWAGGAAVLVLAAALTRQTLERHPVYANSRAFQEDRQDANVGDAGTRAQAVETVTLTAQGKFDEALAEIRELERRAPKSFTTRWNRAYWHQARGENAEAIAAYKVAYEVVSPPSRYKVDVVLARTQMAAGDFDGAVETCRRLTGYSRAAGHHLLLATALSGADNREAAGWARAEAERIDPLISRTVARGARGVIFARPRHPEGRKNELEISYQLAVTACQSASAEPEWFDTLAQLAARTGRFDTAVAASDRGIALAAERGDERWKAALTERRALYAAKKVYGPQE